MTISRILALSSSVSPTSARTFLNSAQAATALMGIIYFIDDYSNAVIVGSSMRPVTDRFGISREKLSFLVVAALALFCGYIPASLGLSPLLSITIAITAMVIVLVTLGRLTKKNEMLD